MSFSIMFEGYVTYGGMSGRDMDALAVGLEENTEFEQLDARIRQVKLLGDLLDEYGVPYQRPAGGHAIFIDAKKVLPNLPKEQFIAQTLGVELYIEAGIRGVEIGSILADRDPETHENRYPALELLRLAIPRRVYTDNHIRVIAAACRNIYERRNEITTGYRITFEAPILRHFTVELEKICRPAGHSDGRGLQPGPRRIRQKGRRSFSGPFRCPMPRRQRSVSRICTALSAAPLRIWSLTHQKVSPLSEVRPRRMRPT